MATNLLLSEHFVFSLRYISECQEQNHPNRVRVATSGKPFLLPTLPPPARANCNEATTRGSRGFLAQTILEISGSQLSPLRTFSLII